jgi:hypothetical protein
MFKIHFYKNNSFSNLTFILASSIYFIFSALLAPLYLLNISSKTLPYPLLITYYASLIPLLYIAYTTLGVKNKKASLSKKIGGIT